MTDLCEYEVMAKLCLSQEERKTLENRAEMLLCSFSVLEKIETENTAPLVTVLELSNVLREDVPNKLLSRDEILINAPERSGGYFKVPGTLD